MEVGHMSRSFILRSVSKRRLFITSKDLEIAHVVFLLTFSLEFIDFYAW
ncbi:unnamed protein product [Spirodela intermedia]|uniref:Uncharacterized protein n=1 Tax=Spirodela intermedia TaxID=51605 RepID=A0A7I8KVL2_SPIIN|nr:unnamed protein product [Spirodela intermedia]